VLSDSIPDATPKVLDGFNDRTFDIGWLPKHDVGQFVFKLKWRVWVARAHLVMWHYLKRFWNAVALENLQDLF